MTWTTENYTNAQWTPKTTSNTAYNAEVTACSQAYTACSTEITACGRLTSIKYPLEPDSWTNNTLNNTNYSSGSLNTTEWS